MSQDMDGYFFEVFSGLPRQGPGSVEMTKKALGMIEGLPKEPRILDIGCGTGASTIVLAEGTDGIITALDFHGPYLEELMEKARSRGVGDRIVPVKGDMKELQRMFDKDPEFDLIWSEGAIYIIGFRKGLEEAGALLRPGGITAVTDVVWLVEEPHPEVKGFWESEYPEISTLDNKLRLIGSSGYELVSHFLLPQDVWAEDYYLPLEENLKGFKDIHKGDPEAKAISEMVEDELRIWREYGDQYGYAFFIMRKLDKQE